jgi:hypothetical protein
MESILIYLMLTADHTWKFMATELTSRSYCEMLKRDVGKVFKDRPGNMRVICSEDTARGA